MHFDLSVLDGISAELLSLCNHSFECLAAGFSEQFGVALELAADQVLEASHDVTPDMLSTDRIALD